MKVRLIVPNCNHNTTPIVAYGPAIIDFAGGFTATQAIGGWKDTAGTIIVESVTVFDCDLKAVYDSHYIAAFFRLAERIASELHQQCVYLEVNGEVEYVHAV